MKEHIFVYRSLTLAQRAGRVLEQHRIRYSLIRLPKPREGEGCGYALKIQHRDLSAAKARLFNTELSPKRIEARGPGGTWQEEKA